MTQPDIIDDRLAKTESYINRIQSEINARVLCSPTSLKTVSPTQPKKPLNGTVIGEIRETKDNVYCRSIQVEMEKEERTCSREFHRVVMNEKMNEKSKASLPKLMSSSMPRLPPPMEGRCVSVNETDISSLWKDIEGIKQLLSRLELKSECNTEESLSVLRTSQQVANSNRIKINIGGIKHETYRSTLKNIPDTRLSWIAEESAVQSPEYDPVMEEFFFDRHPQVFAHVLNYYRTGNLHVPYDVCGPLFEEELQYWGIDDLQVESCCWVSYRQHRDAQETLKEFEGIEFQKDYDDESEPDLSRYGFNVDGISTPQNVSFYKKWQPKIWELLEDPYSSKWAKVFAFLSMLLITLSVLLFCLETMEMFSSNYSQEKMIILEGVCVLFFAVELSVRFIFCPNKLLFIKGVMNWIDLLAIVPFFLTLIITHLTSNQDLHFLQIVRVIRVFRIIKLSKHSIGLQILGHTLKASFRELLLLIFFLAIGVVIFSSLVYYCEKNVPATQFSSIPSTFWWAVITMTTVGYGDMAPETFLGKCIGGLCAVSGVLMIALPVPVIVNNFNLYYSHAQARLKLPKKKRRMLCGAANALKGPAIESFEQAHRISIESIPRIETTTISLTDEQYDDPPNNQTPEYLASLRLKKFARRDSNIFNEPPSEEATNKKINALVKRKSLMPAMPEIEP